MSENSRTSHRSARRLLRFALWVALLCGCDVIRGSGQLTEEDREVGKFDRVVVESEADVEFVQADARSLSIEAEDNLIDEVVTKVENGALVVGAKTGAILQPTLPIAVRISGPDLGLVSMSGSGTFTCETLTSTKLGVHVGGSGSVHVVKLTSDDVDVRMAGSGELTIEALDGEDLRVDIPGSGGVGLAGKVDAQTIHIGGAGSYFGSKLESDDAAVTIDGSGDVEVFAQRTLNVSIDGSGDVRFKGDAVVYSLLGGTGEVSPL